MLCAAAMCLCATTTTTQAGAWEKPEAAAFDLALARPGFFAATIGGAALFVVSLPVALPSKSVKSTFNTLVAYPAKNTFTRPVGDMEAISK